MEFDNKNNKGPTASNDSQIFEIVSLPPLQRIESRQLLEYDDVTDNKKLTVQNTQGVFEKAGKYVFNMGYVRKILLKSCFNRLTFLNT